MIQRILQKNCSLLASQEKLSNKNQKFLSKVKEQESLILKSKKRTIFLEYSLDHHPVTRTVHPQKLRNIFKEDLQYLPKVTDQESPILRSLRNQIFHKDSLDPHLANLAVFYQKVKSRKNHYLNQIKIHFPDRKPKHPQRDLSLL